MRHCKTYMYYKKNDISIFSKVGLVDQTKPCILIYLQKNCKLHKFATTKSNFEKNPLFLTCVSVKRTCISIFSIIGLVDQPKLCTQIYLPKFTNCLNLQLAIRISKNHAFWTCTTP